MHEVQPTFFLGVPRVWEKMMASIEIRPYAFTDAAGEPLSPGLVGRTVSALIDACDGAS